MRDEEDRPRPKPATAQGASISAEALQAMGIDELEARIAALREDIAACEALIASKRAQRSLADSVFGNRDS